MNSSIYKIVAVNIMLTAFLLDYSVVHIIQNHRTEGVLLYGIFLRVSKKILYSPVRQWSS
ncbi:hypothetical protein PPSC2_27125 (plasmid) [Paenibacillus polymyxa SC2]|uniref:Uncharacterized protein n=1 Tax=Paenibacillus polymyxa (strain SC2) TaxID=886882 RepID=A0A0D5ZCX0_PAEPS|nr:hypothetical protein PPSC2_27125 [Paenibacillus polymyxa SC2]